ncbi:unnamed protein product [Brachionus calyciflorus]|uniref:FAM227B n=1 Tax=Brachionus calyciflorus TaxID=104777 RepID=A0A813MCM3_9BILA|nr:unnamed protein product [Brachionus calyciflorus]
MSKHDLSVIDESERQFHFIQALKKLDFFRIQDFVSFEETNLKSLEQNSDYTDSEFSLIEDDNIHIDKELSNINEDSIEKPQRKAIDIINEKIAKLDNTFAQFNEIKAIGRPESYQVVPDAKTKEILASLKEKEEKEIKRFGGIYAMKHVIYNKKTNIPLSFSMKIEEQDSVKVPKLVELYQFTKYDNRHIIELPHEVFLDDVLKKVLDSIVILEKQPHYREFLLNQVFSNPCKFVIHDTFWWCFLQRYQKMPSIQFEYFNRISENYVKLLFTTMESKFRETFFKSFADLLAMCVYTIFCTCFPQSYMTHFNDEFREFICNTTHSWISGCKPIPRSYAHWNFKMIDPSAAVFAQEVLNNKQNNILDDVFNNETSTHHSVSNSKNHSRISNMNSSLKFSNQSVSSMTKRKHANESSILSEPISNKSPKASKIVLPKTKKESHTAGRGPEYESCLFDLFGKSPLVELYLYNYNASKINNAETYIRHSRIIELPPLNAPTYNDLINESIKNIKKIEKEMKLASIKQKSEQLQFDKKRRNSLREYHDKLERVLANQREVAIIGEVITLNTKKDPNSTSFAIDLAFKKAIANTSKH